MLKRKQIYSRTPLNPFLDGSGLRGVNYVVNWVKQGYCNCSPANADSAFKLTMTLKPRASSNASGTTTARNMPARSPNATPVPPVARISGIPGSVSSRRISVRGQSPSVAGSTRVSSLSFKTVQTVEPLKNETPPRTRVTSLTPSKKTPQTLSRSPSASSTLPSLKSPSISLTTPSPQTKKKLNPSSSVTSTPPSKISLNTENSSTTTPSKPKLSLYSTPAKTTKTAIQHSNTPGSKTGSPAKKSSLGRKSGSALLTDDNSLVLSRKPKTTMTSSNGTGTIVATDDSWLSGVGVGGGSGDAFWEADDMSLEMVTDVNDGDVDEDVSFSFSPPPFKPSN